MSFYDDAKFMFLADGAAGKDGRAYNIKPTKGDSYLTVNTDLSTSGSITTSSFSLGWYHGSTQTGDSSIADNQITLLNASGETLAEARASNGTNGNVAEVGVRYRLEYTVVENNNCTDFSTYNASDSPTFTQAPSTVGTHAVYIKNDANQLIILRNSTENSSIVLKDIKVERDIDFTFARGTDLTATRVGKDGYIEKGRENLLLQSNQFDTTWFLNSASLTSGQAGYDGSNDAWELKATGDGSTNLARVSQGSLSVSGVSTFSVYVKAGNTDFVRINLLTSGTPNCNNYFDVANGSVGSSPSGSVAHSSITAAGNGFYRIALTYDGSAGTVDEVRIQVADADGDEIPATNSYVYIQDAQLEQGLVATDYIETGATTATAGLLEDEPRFDYTGGGCPALLIEEERRNYVVHSEHFGASEWAVPSATKNSTFTYMPDEVTPAGSKGVWKYTADTSGDQLGIVPSGSLSIGDTVTNSIYVKRAGGQSTITIDFRDINNDVASTYTLTDADGWKRITATGTCDGTPSIARRHYLNLGTANDAILVWGAQQEDGPYATSYIPTYGATATRTQDQPEELEHGITMGTTCSVFFEGKHVAPDAGQISMFRLRIGTDTNNRLLIHGSAAGATTFPLVVQHKESGTSVNATGGTININESFKVLARIDGTTMDVFVNGSLTDTKPITATDIYDKISLYRTPATDQSGHAVKQAILFDSVLSINDSEIITGTSYSTFGQMASELSYTEYE